jgi:hypothetical protein
MDLSRNNQQLCGVVRVAVAGQDGVARGRGEHAPRDAGRSGPISRSHKQAQGIKKHEPELRGRVVGRNAHAIGEITCVRRIRETIHIAREELAPIRILRVEGMDQAPHVINGHGNTSFRCRSAFR